MFTTGKFRFFGLVTAATFFAVQTQAGLDVISLGSFNGNPSSATAINNHEVIIGYSLTPADDAYPFYYENGSVREIPPLKGEQYLAAGINDFGEIVGNIYPSFTNVGEVQTSPDLPFIFSPEFGRFDLGNDLGSTVSGINDFDEFAGSDGHAYIAGILGIKIDLGTLNGTGTSDASAINNYGQVAGFSTYGDYDVPHAFLYTHDSMLDLGTLGGTYSIALAINNFGDVVGASTTSENEGQHPFLYSHGRMYDLGTLGPTNGYVFSNGNEARAINDQEQIVGVFVTFDGSTHAFVYNHGIMADLNDLADLTTTNGAPGFVVLLEANGINNLGQTVGMGNYWDGTKIIPRAFLLDLNEKAKK